MKIIEALIFFSQDTKFQRNIMKRPPEWYNKQNVLRNILAGLGDLLNQIRWSNWTVNISWLT